MHPTLHAALLIGAGAVVLFLAFLTLLGWLAFRSLRGQSPASDPGAGCLRQAAVLALVAIMAFLGLVGLLAALLFVGHNRMQAGAEAERLAAEQRQQEVQSARASQLAAGAAGAVQQRTVHLRFCVRGQAYDASSSQRQELGALRALVERVTGESSLLKLAAAPDSEPGVLYDFEVPLDIDELTGIEDRLMLELALQSWPEGVEVERLDSLIRY